MLVACSRFLPEINHGILTADDSLQGGLVVRHEFVQRAADEADFFSQLGPVTFAVGFAQQLDVARGWGGVAGEGREQGGFAGSVGP